jgi:oxaloacetate decarboxylase alpha subunit
MTLSRRARLGVSALQCASGAAADGISNPPVERIVANLRALGHRVDIDDEALAEVSQLLHALAAAKACRGPPAGLRRGVPAAPACPAARSAPCAAISAESRISHLEGAVLEELDRVRQELGWPIVMTPFAQMVITQAVMNVTAGALRRDPDEVIRYALGRFGKPNVPIDPQVMERIESLPRTRELRAEPPMAELSELRRRVDAANDEDFLLARHHAGGLCYKDFDMRRVGRGGGTQIRGKL